MSASTRGGSAGRCGATCAPAGCARAAARSASSSPRPASSRPTRTAARKAQEALIALWLEAWLSKEEILSRYLSNVYFGDNVYGLRAAARHYFNVDPEQLTLAQAAMLAGVVNAPTPARADHQHRGGPAPRARLVLGAMREVGYHRRRQLAAVRPARRPPRPARRRARPAPISPTGCCPRRPS